jgi:predicted flap endonuclease-1-like 5' DNA nuclease
MEPRHRTWAVYILFALAVVAGILALLDAARYMGWLAFTADVPFLGEIRFVLPQAQWFAAILSAIVGIIWFVVAGWLWNLNPSGWMFVVVIAIFNLILLFLALLGRTTLDQILLAVLVNALALILALLPSTKEAFMPPGPSPEAVAAANEAAAREAAAKEAAAKEAAAKEAAAKEAAAKEAAAKEAAAKEAAAREAAAKEAAAKEAAAVENLAKIEGVGPKIAAALVAAGITSYDELKATPVEELRKVLADAGISADPSTWPEQAGLAAAGRWDDLQALQDDLKGGRVS